MFDEHVFVFMPFKIEISYKAKKRFIRTALRA